MQIYLGSAAGVRVAVEGRASQPVMRHHLRNLGWSLAESGGQQLISWVTIIAVARFVGPEAIGVMGLQWGLAAILTAIGSFGLSSGLLRRQTVVVDDYSAAQSFSIGASMGLYVLVVASSSFLESLYGYAGLGPMICVSQLVVLANGWTMPRQILLNRLHRFSAMARATLVSSMTSSVVGLALAWKGYGCWSLVWHQVTFATTRLILTTWSSPRIPLVPSNKRRILPLIIFGWKVMIADLLDMFFTTGMPLVTGLFMPINQVGYLNQADRLRSAPMNTLVLAIQKVSVPILAERRGDHGLYLETLHGVLRLVAFLGSGLMCILVATAPAMFTLVMKEQWLPAIPVYQWLCVAGIGWCISAVCMSAIVVEGRGWLLLGLEISKKVVLAFALVATMSLGSVAVAQGMAAAMLFALVVNLSACAFIAGDKISSLIASVATPVAVALVAGLFAWIPSLIVREPAPLLAIQLVLGTAVMLVSTYSLDPRGRSMIRSAMGLSQSGSVDE